MWAYAITAPGRLERVEVPVPEPGPGRVLVRLRAGGICGSDLPSFVGRRNTFVDFVGIHDAQLAFETAVSPVAGRLKVVLEVEWRR